MKSGPFRKALPGCLNWLVAKKSFHCGNTRINNENKTMGNEDDDSKIENKQFNNNNKIQGSFNSLIKDTDSIDPKTEFRHLPKYIQIVINKLSTDSNKKNMVLQNKLVISEKNFKHYSNQV